MFGVNCLAQTVADRTRALANIQRLQPRAVVVLDDTAFAQSVRQALPNTLVILRNYHPDDSQWHKKLSAAQWFTTYAPFAQNGLILYCFNEPNGYEDLRGLAAWCAQVIDIASANNVRLCLPNFSVGHPDETRVNAGELDALLQAFHRHPEHFLGLHEYAQQSTVTERPYIIGRYNILLRRCDTLGLRRPKVIMTEYGRDVGGGPNDGWKGVPFTEQEYYDFLVGGADAYTPNDVPVCIFCYGPGFGGRFASFDIEGANDLIDQLVAYNDATRIITEPVPKPTNATRAVPVRVILPTGSAVNVRVGPGTNYSVTAQVRNGDVIAYYPDNTIRGGAYTWAYVENQVLNGWSALEVLTFEQLQGTIIEGPRPNDPRLIPQSTNAAAQLSADSDGAASAFADAQMVDHYLQEIAAQLDHALRLSPEGELRDTLISARASLDKLDALRSAAQRRQQP